MRAAACKGRGRAMALLREGKTKVTLAHAEEMLKSPGMTDEGIQDWLALKIVALFLLGREEEATRIAKCHSDETRQVIYERVGSIMLREIAGYAEKAFVVRAEVTPKGGSELRSADPSAKGAVVDCVVWSASDFQAVEIARRELEHDSYDMIAADEVLELSKTSWSTPVADAEFDRLAGLALLTCGASYGKFNYW